jgi:regulator of cell morphogenesis and NO signaling
VTRRNLFAAEAESSPFADLAEWTSAPLTDLISYLVNVEHAQVRSRLPELQQLMNEVVDAFGHEHGTLAPLSKIFAALHCVLISHMDHEERYLFPEIIRYEDAIRIGKPIIGSPFSAFGGPVHVIESEHDCTGAALRLIRDFTQNYQVPAPGSPVYSALFEGLRQLEYTLRRHMYLENIILFARAAALRTKREPV